jgi:hypothetical protein
VGGPDLQPGLNSCPHGPTISSAVLGASAAEQRQGTANA